MESAVKYFGTTEPSRKTAKGWWSKYIKKAQKIHKNAQKKYKLRQTPTNYADYQSTKNHLKSLIAESKVKQWQKETDFLNQSSDSAQFWHRYEKVTQKKKNNIVEPLYEPDTSTYIFEDEKISNKLQYYHCQREDNDLYDNDFKNEIEAKLNDIIENIQIDPNSTFFSHKDVEEAIKSSNKSSAPGPDRITMDLIQNGGEQLIISLTLIMQCSHQIGYYPALWKRDNRIYLKKPGKDNYRVEKSYRSISISNILGKVFERIILKEATNILTENGFLENKNLYAYQKNKNAPQALLPLVEQMHTCITEGKFGIAVMADLQGAFDAVWRDGAIYKLHQAGIKGNL